MSGVTANFLEDTAQRKILFFTGKGGVGKTTLTWAAALAAKRAGRRVCVASWSPYGTVDQPRDLAETGIDWLPLETLQCFKEYALQTLKFERVYHAIFDNHVLRTFLQSAPGISDGVIAGKIWDVSQSGKYDTVFVDLPSSGHTYSFFESPIGIQKVFRVGFVHRHAKHIAETFQSTECRVHFVALPEELSLTESRELKTKLEAALSLNFGFVFVNQCLPKFQLPGEEDVPERLRPRLRLYREREKTEREAIRYAEELRMPVRRLERLPSSTEREAVEAIASALEAM